MSPSDPKDKRAIASISDSLGVSFPAENKETNKHITKEITQIIPVNLFEDNVDGPEPISDLKNLIIIQNIILLVYINYNDLL